MSIQLCIYVHTSSIQISHIIFNPDKYDVRTSFPQLGDQKWRSEHCHRNDVYVPHFLNSVIRSGDPNTATGMQVDCLSGFFLKLRE